MEVKRASHPAKDNSIKSLLGQYGGDMWLPPFLWFLALLIRPLCLF